MDTEVTKLKTQIRHIGHEIRNQLSICDIYSEILKKHLIKEGVKNSSIDNALNCIQNAVKLIGNNLLDLISMGDIVIHSCDSDKLLQNSIEMSKVYVKDKEINFIEDLESGVKILVDENKFQGCIINIIKNAIEAINVKGEINITAKTCDDYLVIDISNNGEPIPADKVNDIFADGFTTKSTGSGVGLYLCKQNIEAMKGTVNLIQSNNVSTVFEIKVKKF